ncbi:MAG: hypothetical protein PVJ80_14345 [Gemmatimonadota bacterium]|jgi:hypothetical protein
MRQTTRGIGTGLAVLMAMLCPLAVSAQSDLDASEAQAFIGAWTVSMTSDFGDFTMDLEIQDEGGKVAASIGAPDMGGPMESVSDVSMNGEDLVLAWEMDAQGQFVPAMMTLTVDGAGLTTVLDIADGQFSAPGEATRSGS